MKKILLTTFIINTMVFSQSFTLKGVTFDKNTKKPLESATIHAENPQDSSLVAYSISDKNGRFKVSGNTKARELNVYVSFVGYASLHKFVKINKKEIDLGNLFLEETAEQLSDVVVMGSLPPVTIKKDTLEFNADSFKTRPDATVEELLKKLPGVEVDSDGTIQVNGKPVKEVLVNGKPFFGDDPKIATKNLTKDIVNKIQVSDYKTREERFLGKQGDPENKSLNIQLKENKNKGHFGRVTAGYGTENRYQASGMLNVFNNEQKISVLANSNNINSSGFSMGEISDMLGYVSRNYIDSQSNGIKTTHSAGVNYVDQWDKTIDVSGNYFFGNNHRENRSNQQREYFLTDRHYFTESTYESKEEQESHRVSTELEFKPSKTLQIRVSPSFNYSTHQSNGHSNDSSFDENRQLVNQSEVFRRSENSNNAFSNNLSISQRIGEKGASIRFNFNNNNSQTEADDFFNNTRTLQSSGTTAERQQSTTKSRSDMYRMSLSVRQPIIDKVFWETDYTLRQQKETSQKNTYNADASGDFTIFNTPLSSNFITKNSQQTLQTGLNLERDKFRARLRAGGIFTTLSNEDFLQHTHFEKEYQNLYLQTNFNYRPSQGITFSADYSTSVNNPSVYQLQPIADVSNPLHTRQGNPNLNPEYTQRISVWFFRFNQEKIGFNGSFNASWTDDKIVSLTTTDANLIRQTTYTNVGGNYSLRANFGARKTHRFDKKRLEYSLGVSLQTGKSNQFSNGTLFANTSNTFSPNAQIDFSVEEIFNLNVSYNLQLTENKYNIASLTNQSVTTHRIEAETNATFFKKLTLANALVYRYNPNLIGNFNKSAIFWNATAEYKVLKDKGIIRLTIHDVLKQNNNAHRLVSQDYIEEGETLILQQYFMLGFTYKLGQFGGKRAEPRRHFRIGRP